MTATVVGNGTWLSVGEVAEILGIAPNTVRRYMAAGRFDEPIRPKTLPGGGHRRIHKDSVGRLQAEIDGGTAAQDSPAE
ncbi:helix-turn-helix domain-containing protein [Dactylosporangium sp. NPDC000555]|uniref:helix-turn-helix domain-containing protein n=1 Tax=Dactylosporangium sp. NPDC000555 TaxID=3154260 RepID=UPI003320C74F